MKKENKEKISTRDQIINSALALFADNGYEATSISDICEKASVTKGALYWHFKTKQDLYSKLIYGILDSYLNDIKDIGKEGYDTIGYLREFTKETFISIEQNIKYQQGFRLIYRETQLDRSSELKDAILSLNNSLDFSDFFNKLIDNGDISSSLTGRQFSEMYKSMTDNLVLNWFWSDRKFKLSEWGLNYFDYMFRLDLDKEKR